MTLPSLQHLRTTGANWVAIVVTQYQDLHNTTEIYPLYEPLESSYYTYVTASDDDIRHAIAQAHGEGLKVCLAWIWLDLMLC